AKNWAKYSNVPLLTFTNQFYGALLCHYDDLNDKTKYLIPHMTKNNWLYNYQYIDYLEKILQQMENRFSHSSNMHQSVRELREYYTEFEEEFTIFFTELSTLDRKSTRLNSSHVKISYAVFCLKKKKIMNIYHT